MIIQKYKTCVFCGSSKLKANNSLKFIHNFYTNSIKNDLGLNDLFFKKMKTYQCTNCHVVQNNPWFSKKISFKIFNQIYGQHNRNWLNVLNFFKKGLKPNHGDLFKILVKNFKIKTYCEFNAPFMGLMIDFFNKEYNQNLKLNKNMFNYSLNYLSSRQLAGENKLSRNKKETEAKKYLKKLNKFKNKIRLKKIIKKTLIVDNSYLSWLYNDNYKSVNSRSLASELFDINIEELDLKKNLKSMIYLDYLIH